MNGFLCAEDEARFTRHRLASFDALWGAQLEPVDEPNVARGGWSAVFRLEIEGQGYYLKRQSNYRVRSLRHPFGEPTLARELRNIQRYRRLGIPAVQAAYYASRNSSEGPQAMLLTRELSGWQELGAWLSQWDALSPVSRTAIVTACGTLSRVLHRAGQRHGCLYPKHLFLRETAQGFESCLIDLEKSRPLRPGRRDRLRDLEPFVRRTGAWTIDDLKLFLVSYLGRSANDTRLTSWLELIGHIRNENGRRA